ncbi:hypothetical protein QCA50_000829 [Cerrena zonata]|uniref:Nucleolar protein 14 n=1 Tax=Cerrena zonata TaxID=2478898 RepID=A0AAW0GRH6_9APHY
MAKGSQLSQLKTALNKAGLTPQQQQNGKKRKRAVLDDKEKERRATKLKEIQQKMNPFDVKVTKLKHDVGGRKIAGLMGRPAQSKQAGIEQRKKTLLKEFEERDRAGGIVDRRFGENDPTMTPEERMLERFTRERQRTSKGDAFNLEDDDELTHYGQSLSKLDDFDNVGLNLEDEEEDMGMLDRDTVGRSHFGGFDEDEGSEDEDGQPERKRSKAEVMAEVIAKSKDYKFMRQNQQEEDENLRHELDNELDSIRSLLFAPDTTLLPVESAATSEPKTSIDALVKAPHPDEDQEYDQFVRELAFEARAKPKNRTKTEEELALEEKEMLEKAEKQRIRRMNGEEDEEDDNGDGDGKRKGKRKGRGGDDLEDDFMDEDANWSGLGAGLGGAGDADVEGSIEGSDEEEGDGEDDEEEDEGSDEEEEEDGISMPSDEDEADGEDGETEALISSSQKTSSKKKTTFSNQELPFTFPCPETHDEFLEIVESVRDEDVPTVVKRIRTLHHPSLAEDNKFKLQALTGVLVDHILYLASPPSPKFSVLSSLIPHIYSLSKQYPIQSAHHFIAKLNLMQKNLKRGLAQGVTDPESRTWPGLPELSLLRVVGIVWSTSDMHHHVVSPARLLIGSYLGLCRVRSIQDIASGLFLCTLYLQFEELSKRLVPEALNFLTNSVLHLAPTKFKNIASLPGGFPSPDFRSVSLALDTKKAKKLTSLKPNLTSLLSGDSHGEQAKTDLLCLSFDLLGQYADMYKGLEGFIDLCEPIVDVLQGINSKPLSTELEKKLSSLLDTLNRLLKFARQSRRPLRLQAHKPIPIPSYVPKFEHTTSNYLRNRDPDHERNEAAKLRSQYKQEKKGAIRELRKDGRFLAAEQQKKQKAKDQAYNTSMKRVFGSIEGERAEQKALEREKSRDKKRAGRK